MQSTKTLAILLAAASTVAAQGLVQATGQFDILLKAGDTVVGTDIGSGDAVARSSFPFSNPAVDVEGNAIWVTQLQENLNGVVNGGFSASGPFFIDNSRVITYGRTANDMQVLMRAGGPVPGMPGFNLGALSSFSSATAQNTTNPFNTSGTLVGSGGHVAVPADIYDPSWSGGVTYGVDDQVLLVGKPGSIKPRLRRGQATMAGGTTTIIQTVATLSGQFMHIDKAGNALVSLRLADSVAPLPLNGDAGWFLVPDGWDSVPGYDLMNHAIVFEGDLMNGGAQVVNSLSTQCLIDNNGFILHKGNFSTTAGTAPATSSTDDYLALWDPGTMTHTVIAREDDPITVVDNGQGPVTGVRLNTLNVNAHSLSFSNKHIAFLTSLRNTPLGFDDDAALILGQPGSLKAVLRQSDPIPGHPGAYLSSVNQNSIKVYDDGSVTFGGTMSSVQGAGNASSANAWPGSLQQYAFFRYDGPTGTWGTINIYGDTAPGFPAGWTIGTSTNRMTIPYSQPAFGTDADGSIYEIAVTDGVEDRSCHFHWSKTHGLRPFVVESTTAGDDFGFGPCSSFFGTSTYSLGEPGFFGLNNNGDGFFQCFSGSTASILRCRMSTLTTDTASIQASTGGTQNLKLDLGTTGASQICFTLGCIGSTRPGFSLPYGGVLHHIPLSPDFWFNAVPGAWGGPMYPAGINVTDANGKATSPFNFPPAGYMAGAMFNHCLVTLTPGVLQHISSPASCHLY